MGYKGSKGCSNRCDCGGYNECSSSIDAQSVLSVGSGAYYSANCQLFAISLLPVTGGSSLIVFLENPEDSGVNVSINVVSVSNFEIDPCVLISSFNCDPCKFKTKPLDTFSINTGCQYSSAAVVEYAVLKQAPCPKYYSQNSQDIVGPVQTFRLMRNGNFILAPGTSCACIVSTLDGAPINCGVDLRWYETPCN